MVSTICVSKWDKALRRDDSLSHPLTRMVLTLSLDESTMVTALHHVNVTVPSELEDATKHFYGAVLGLKQVPKPAAARQNGAWYQIGDNQLHLSIEDEAPERISSRHVCFNVTSLAETEKRFRDAGVEIIPDPRPIPGNERFYVRDPGGNQLEIVQQK